MNIKKDIDERQSAIEHRKGAACVIAGAGTGKTTSLVNRISFLTQTLKISPEKILVTTFTRKATAELYTRCFEKLGEIAHKLRITTIDSAILDFSQQAIREGNMSPFKLFGEAEQRILLLYCTQEVLKEEAKQEEKRLEESFQGRKIRNEKFLKINENKRKILAKELLKVRNKKQEYVLKKALKEKDSEILRFQESLSGKWEDSYDYKYKCGTRKLSNYREETKGIETLIDTVSEYLHFEKSDIAKRKRIIRKIKSINNTHFGRAVYYEIGVFPKRWFIGEHIIAEIAKKYFEETNKLGLKDYETVSKELLSCLKKNKSFAKIISSEFAAILVDEFQDTSRVQAEILLQLAGAKKNIWVVGDPCQQIYEWRGAAPDNFKWFINVTKAKKYSLMNNYRSTQKILDGAFNFLNKEIPHLKKSGLHQKLVSNRSETPLPIFASDINRALSFLKGFLDSNPNFKKQGIAILSRQLTKSKIEQIKRCALNAGFKLSDLQFHSYSADIAVEKIIGSHYSLPNSKSKNALDDLYSNKKVKKHIENALKKNDFSDFRMIRPLANAANAIDSTLPQNSFTFREAWHALKKTQDREIQVSSAIAEKQDAIQVMTIHAAKGLEFPIVLLMEFGKKFPLPFKEDYRVAYVGATRAKDLLILTHTQQKPQDVLEKFSAVPISSTTYFDIRIPSYKDNHAHPIIAATHLELYEQCPLKFAAYNEGRFLPVWSKKQSEGARLHKAIEYFLLSGLSTNKSIITDCFNRGFQDGDSPMRKLPPASITQIRNAFENITDSVSSNYKKVIAVEQKYRYVHGTTGQIEGIIDSILERKDGAIILKEWKSWNGKPRLTKNAELQTRAGALGIFSQKSISIDEVQIVPMLSQNLKKDTIKFTNNDKFIIESKNIFDTVFEQLKNRNYNAEKGIHCRFCQLKSNCPAWNGKK